MFFPQYPYLNIQDLNLDYILKSIKDMKQEIANFVKFNAIKYADPLEWNITTQYQANTVVIDNVNHIAYLSTQPVPSGVLLTDTDYWTPILDLTSFYAEIGDLNDLQTINRDTLVDAINECVTNITGLVNAVSVLNDNTDKLLLTQNNGLDYQGKTVVKKLQYITTLSGNASYNSLQACTYNPNTGHLIVAILKSEDEGMLVELDSDFLTVINRRTFTGSELQHANDMCYNSTTDKLYVAGYREGGPNSNRIMEFDGTTLNYIQTINLLPASTDGNYVTSKITYDPDNDVYYTYSNYTLNKYDNVFTLIDSISLPINKIVAASFDPWLTGNNAIGQTIEFYNGKLVFNVMLISGTQFQNCLVIKNTDGSDFSSIIPIPSTINEAEGTFVKDGILHALYGYGSYSIMAFYPQTMGFANVGSNIFGSAIEIPDGTDLNDIIIPGLYFCASGTHALTLTNCPIQHGFSMLVLCDGANYVQLIYANFTPIYTAARTISYAGSASNWYHDEKQNQTGVQRTIKFVTSGLVTSSKTTILFELPCGHIEDSLANISIDGFSLNIGSDAGLINDGVNSNVQDTGATMYIDSKSENGLIVRVLRNDSNAFGVTANNSPVLVYGVSVTFTP